MDGDDQIRKLAVSVENMVQTQRLTIPITAANTLAQITWTFAVPFSAAPMVVATVIGTSITSGATPCVQSISTTTTGIGGVRTSGTAAFDVFVIAVGPVTAVS
jgi:hypothetical protein